MRMQISKITDLSFNESLSDASEFKMSGFLSEWLFSIGFWRAFNSEHGTMFDQFEEDEAETTVVQDVASAVAELVDSIGHSEEDVVEFAFRRLPDGTAITANTTKEDLLKELKSLHQFLEASVERKSTLLFSL
ncbi:hypothetical protein [Paraburkholderia silvatlantica]|uniref:hypothetical protein n=1 Tax=Paraburkholderia silvatlantica TaxID=321895 RepID=UPI0037501421